jgi:3-oxoacyl-[acyl-carrier-protein] synthase II
MDTFIHFGIAAAVPRPWPTPVCRRARRSSDELATRIGCVIGSGIGGLPLIEATHTS